MAVTEQSFTKTFWKKLRRNKGAVFGLIVIVLAIITALFAYVLAPDATPDANRIIVEIAAKKPGYQQQFFLLDKEANAGGSLLFGKDDAVQYIPITAYSAFKDSIEVDKYVDDGVTEKLKFALNGRDYHEAVTNKTFWLGTDKFGRDILSRLIVGVRVSLSVGLIAVLISLTVGIFLGAVAGYFRGWIDEAILWLINVVWSIPTLLLVFAITLALGKGFWQVFIAVGLTLWVNVARLVRGQILSIRELNYIEATKAMGFSHGRTIFKHILPNIMGPVIVIAASNFASAIVIEAGLSFLGVGVQAPQPSWGLMIKENYNFIITNNPMLAIAPGIAIMLLVLAFNLLGNGLRDVLDVRN
ncbi:ABC transporter permease [Lacibacter luteus]|uniref:ABC transporter permease n=1 Tax=Lacibacter luteus TaxID=2508719 RepID=A0A4Q1CKF7_9BACT|nr:ABC transporter permease [Lacibacter luteus]RXK60887.1 ABC transporter permease [Lacibacter luteus]